MNGTTEHPIFYWHDSPGNRFRVDVGDADEAAECPHCVPVYSAETVDRLRARVAELESQERCGWIRTSGWSNELYSFDRSDNEDGTFALTVSERDGRRLVEIDRLTASDLERIVDVVGDGVVSRPAAELEAATVFVRHDEDDAAKDGA